ncbi:MAG: rhomboid family intramembrane serine protease [Actinomycetota bacterium]|nr:rhomboid family intramembrane serine protease [Actinomycetota bacterium]
MADEPMRCYRHPDRETYLSCSECGRPICGDCMTPAPVGQRCPEHSGKPQGVARVATGVKRAGFEGTGALVTKALIAINLLVYLATVAQGAGLNNPGGNLFTKGLLFGPWVANGEWWRLITSAFLHANLIHIAFNMYFLWFVGTAVEQALGRGRFLLVYVVSGLAGSAGALVWTPNSATVGASGAIFGILGAALILERQRMYVLGGSALGLVVINLALSFLISGISIGGHIGGLIGGGAATLALSHFGRGHAAYSRLGVAGIAGVVGIGVASIAVAYWAANSGGL